MPDTASAPDRPAGVAADWVYHAPDSIDVEWWAPPAFLDEGTTRDLPSCIAAPAADSAAAALAPDEPGLPMTAAVRRGTLASVVEAHHFGVTDDGDYVTQGRASSEAARIIGDGWIALAGSVWVPRGAADPGSSADQTVPVLLGVARAADGCQLVFLERGEGIGSIDSLAAVLKTVRPIAP